MITRYIGYYSIWYGLRGEKMNKLYLMYIPKVQGESTDFKLVKALKKCMKYYSGENNIISSPGYLSSLKYVGDFVKEFEKIVPKKNSILIGYFKGMNKFNRLSGSCDLIDEHYTKLIGTGKFKKLKIKIANKSDHRKMTFIYGIKESSLYDFESYELNSGTKDKFLDSIIVNAVFIGSSNQSYNTYYGGASSRAKKGEADVLMFVTDNVETLKNDMYVDGTVIYEELLGTSKEPHEYLKDILREFLETALS